MQAAGGQGPGARGECTPGGGGAGARGLYGSGGSGGGPSSFTEECCVGDVTTCLMACELSDLLELAAPSNLMTEYGGAERMTVGWQAGVGVGELPSSNMGGGCGGVLQPASAMRGEGGPGSGDDVLVSAADSPSLLHRESTFRLFSFRSWKRLMLSRSHGPRLSVIIPIVEVMLCSRCVCAEAARASSGPSLRS